MENEDYKILQDFSIQTDYVKEAWRPDLVVVDKERSCKDRKISRLGKGVTEDMEC